MSGEGFCHYCKGTTQVGDEIDGETSLRPYGPQGQDVCWVCGNKPENKAVTDAQIDARIKSIGVEAFIEAEHITPTDLAIAMSELLKRGELN